MEFYFDFELKLSEYDIYERDSAECNSLISEINYNLKNIENTIYNMDEKFNRVQSGLGYYKNELSKKTNDKCREIENNFASNYNLMENSYKEFIRDYNNLKEKIANLRNDS